jgi:hypothetical protein
VPPDISGQPPCQQVRQAGAHRHPRLSTATNNWASPILPMPSGS